MRCDVAVVGAGLVGAAFALALERGGLRVALVDRGALAIPAASEDWDQRVFAISPGSADFLHALGVWSALPTDRLQAIERMRIWNEAGDSPLEFDAYDFTLRALAWIVEQKSLQEALLRRLAEASGPGTWLSLFDRTELLGFDAGDSEVCLRLAGRPDLCARLVVGADGLRSGVRRAAGIGGEPLPYGQTAVVANFRCARSHRGSALQWFLPDGAILALLPLPGSRVSMVWSMAQSAAQSLSERPAQELAAAVTRASGGALGALEALGGLAQYPLSHLRLARPIAPRFALIGDAAHGLHPLAGQGVNLGFGDAAALARVLETRGPLIDCGDYTLLSRYARARAAPVAAMQGLTHGLWQLLQHNDLLSRNLRQAAFSVANGFPGLRRLLAQPALR